MHQPRDTQRFFMDHLLCAKRWVPAASSVTQGLWKIISSSSGSLWLLPWGGGALQNPGLTHVARGPLLEASLATRSSWQPLWGAAAVTSCAGRAVPSLAWGCHHPPRIGSATLGLKGPILCRGGHNKTQLSSVTLFF